jgi:hypothetical protein
MTKKDVVALAEVLRIHNWTVDGRTEFTPDHLLVLADFLVSKGPNFNQKRWIDYIAGECDEWIFAERDSTLIPGATVEDKFVPRVKRDEYIPKRGRRSRYNRISEAPTEET